MTGPAFPTPPPPRTDQPPVSGSASGSGIHGWPARVGAYEIEALLGAGGMGRVFRARQQPLGRGVALKMLDARLAASDPEYVSRFVREARAAARLLHENVVRVFDAGSERAVGQDGTPGPLVHFIAYELIDGPNLDDLLREEGRLGQERALRIALCICRGLGAIEASNLVHRDLKPGNVLIDRDGTPKIADLGLAKVRDASNRLTQTGDVLGTPAYMAPEQILARGDVDVRADLYALGLMLYRMTTGELALSGEDAFTTFDRHISEDCPDPRRMVASLSEGFATLVADLTAREPADRPTLAETTARIESLIERPERSTGSYSRAAGRARAEARELARRARRRPAMVGAFGLLAVAIAAGALAVLDRRGPSPSSAPAAQPETASAASSAPDATTEPAPAATATVAEPSERPGTTAPSPWPVADGWRTAWTLGDRAAPPRAEPASAWREPGREADPWSVLTGERAGLPDLFAGDAVPLEDGRLLVRYQLSRAGHAEVATPGTYFRRGTPSSHRLGAPGQPHEGHPSVAIDCPNDTGILWVTLGRSRWTDARIDLHFRAHAIDMTGFTVQVARGEPRDATGELAFEDRAKRARVGLATVPFDVAGDWHRVRFEPTGPAGERVVIDGRARPDLDAGARAAAGPPLPAILGFTEGRFEVCDAIELRGRPARPDRPALALVPGERATSTRTTVAFRVRSAGAGGPFVGLGSPDADALVLELDADELRLSHGERVLAQRPVPAGGERRGWLMLRRRGAELLARARVDGTEYEIELAEPLPLAAESPRAFYGSTAPRVRFERVEVHDGPDDARARELDRTAAREGPAACERLLRGAADPVSQWRAAAVSLARGSLPAWRDDALVGEALEAERRERAREAVETLESAIDRLGPGPVRDDAIVRAAYASVLAADPSLAHRVAPRLREGRLGPLLDSLETARHMESVSARLISRLVSAYSHRLGEAPDVLEAALTIADAVVDEGHAMQPSLLRMRGLFLRDHGGDPQGAIALLEQALARGAPLAITENDIGIALLRLGRYADASTRIRAAIAIEPNNYWFWIQLQQAEGGRGDRQAAFEAALGTLAAAPDRGNFLQGMLRWLGDPNVTPGRRAAGFLAVAGALEARGEPDQAQQCLANARQLAAAVPETEPSREADLALYVRVALGERPRLPAREDRPTAVLAHLRARAGDDAREVLAAAAGRDLFVGSLARLDPTLAPLIDR